MIRAIETRYKGYRFRSRLEARWAVFFDALGLRWEYEPEGFELGDGVRYLPDFVLHQAPRSDGAKRDPRYARLYAEVKPYGQSSEKARLLAKAGYLVLLLDGEPTNRTYTMLLSYSGGYEMVFHRVTGVSFYDSDYYSKREELPRAEWGAIAAARSARFEHGECGAPA